MASEPRVIIVGAGPVGLSLALGLCVQGIRSIVLEDAPALSEHSKAPGIMARTLEIFRSWGVIDRFMAEGTFIDHPRLWMSGDATPIASVDLSWLVGRTAYPGLMVLPQNRTEALLYQKIQELGLAEVRFGTRVTGFSQDGSGVTVQVSARVGEAYQLYGDYLVGCDGAHSIVRTGLGWNLEGKTYQSRFLLADVKLGDARNDLPWPRFSPQPTGLMFALRLEPDLWRIIATLRPEDPTDEAQGHGALERRVAALFGPGSFERVWSSIFHIHCRNSPRFRLERVLIAGDAAHLNSPAGGQGMNSGIQDAHNLAWKLARALKGAEADRLLDSYEQERRSAVMSHVDRYTDLLTRIGLMPLPRTRLAIATMARFALKQDLFVRQVAPRFAMLDACYRTSELVSGHGRLLGCRAPDGELRDAAGRTSRLLDLVGPGAVLLLFDDGRLPGWNQDQVRALCAPVEDLRVVRLMPTSAPPEPTALRDASGALWRDWYAGGTTAALVRPDAHVGWLAERPTPEALVEGVRRALGA